MEFDQKIRSIIKHGGLSRALEIYGERRAKGWSLRSFTYSWPKKIFLRPLTRIAPVDHFLIPHITPPKAYGGIATLLHLAIERVRSGRQVHVILFDEKGKLDDLPLIAQLNPTEWSALRSRFSLSDASSSSEIVIDAGPDDQYIASAWWTKFSLDHAIPSLKPHQLIYIIQDDESLFYDKSDAIENELSHMARSSLAGSYHAIINSDFLADYFLNQSLLSRNTLQSLRIISPLIDHQLFF